MAVIETARMTVLNREIHPKRILAVAKAKRRNGRVVHFTHIYMHLEADVEELHNVVLTSVRSPGLGHSAK